jgi:flagellar hook-associated protein 1 FlgK
MSFDFGIANGLRALIAARLGMQTAGNNVANANTPGYTRQRIELASSLPFSLGGLQIGTGVDVTGITRLVDDGLERRLQLQLGVVGGAEVDQSRFDELESLLGDPDGGLSGGLSGFFGAVDQLRTDPSDRSLRGGVVQAGNTLAQGFQLLSQRLGELRGSTFDEVQGLVQQIDQMTSQVAELNGQITALEADGSQANDLRDTRDQQIKEIAKLIDVRPIQRATGAVDLLVGGRLLVSGSSATTLGIGKSAAGTTELRLGNQAVTPREGRIAALLRQETGNLPTYSDKVDRLARNLILEVNRVQTTGVPRSGAYQSLDSYYGAGDGNGDGTHGDELLSQ